VVVLEREPFLAAHQSGRNSGVIHSGAYYVPGSLRARSCVSGARLLEEYCEQRRIPLRRCGKVIVAGSAAEVPGLEEIHRRGVANGVAELTRLGPEQLAEIEPHVRGVAALHLPRVAAVDYAAVTRELAADVAERGGTVRLGVEATGIAVQGDATLVGTADRTLRAGAVVVCAGLWSDRLATAAGAPRQPRIVPFRGDFWVLRADRDALVRGMVYPVPDPALPFLGVHATRRADGEVWLGPTAVLALQRDGYRRGAVRWADVAEMATDTDVARLLLRHWRTADDVLPGPCGIRAQALGPSGRLLDDFVTWQRGPVLCVRNAPSPAATASLAIARLVVDRLGG